MAEAFKIDTAEEVLERGTKKGASMGNKILEVLPATSPLVTPIFSLLLFDQAQKERFRLMNEEELEQVHELGILSGQVHDLEQDNVKLYEKIRFLPMVTSLYQGYNKQKLDPILQKISQPEKIRKFGQLIMILILVWFMFIRQFIDPVSIRF